MVIQQIKRGKGYNYQLLFYPSDLIDAERDTIISILDESELMLTEW